MAAHVVVISLASDFGCQVQMTNMDDQLLDVLGQFELSYWQLASSGHLPEAYDVAIIEGAVTTPEHVELLKRVRATASTVILIGACAVQGGIPGLAADGFDDRLACVYGDDGSRLECVAGISPRPVDAIIDVDYRVPGCPIQPDELVAVLQRRAHGPVRPAVARPDVRFVQGRREPVLLRARRRLSGHGHALRVRRKVHLAGPPVHRVPRHRQGCDLTYARQVLVERGLNPDRLATALELYNSLTEVAR